MRSKSKPALSALRRFSLRLRIIPFSPILCLAVLSFALAGCVHPGPVSSSPTSTAAPSESWLDTKLYFSLGPADHPEQGVSEAQWRGFLDREVTSRFPDGLSVIDIYGQWRGAADSTTLRERSKLLNFVYPDNAENRAKIDAIRAAWKKMTGDQSVLKVTVPADVSF